ncbi:hypothetical protein TI04_03335 [Achromatium sp. WMS2]|nr:hypothetical protein TI04_03335 [Achromatium sp. WMS2]
MDAKVKSKLNSKPKAQSNPHSWLILDTKYSGSLLAWSVNARLLLVAVILLPFWILVLGLLQ